MRFPFVRCTSCAEHGVAGMACGVGCDVQVPFYGSYHEADPVQIAQEGVDQFKKEVCGGKRVEAGGARR